jgi:hypothetical protein
MRSSFSYFARRQHTCGVGSHMLDWGIRLYTLKDCNLQIISIFSKHLVVNVDLRFRAFAE